LPITPSPWWTSWSSIATAAPASPPPIDPAHCRIAASFADTSGLEPARGRRRRRQCRPWC
jgi:hypothetical protein